MTLPYQMPINPISATLLRSGQVLIVAGSENDAKNNSEGSESYRAALWDPTGPTQSSIVVQNLTYDVFCSGTAALPDGRALVVGGTSDYSFTGENRASFFDPATNQWIQSQNMVDGRWYATATTLGRWASDGLLRSAADRRHQQHASRSTTSRTRAPAGAARSAAPFTPPLYPRMWVLPNGRVFYSGHGSGGSNSSGWIFDPVARTWTASAATTMNRSYGTSVLLPLLPPTYTPKVMALGGGGNPATATTEIIDLSATSPVWTPGPSMSTGRIQMDAVLLPERQGARPWWVGEQRGSGRAREGGGPLRSDLATPSARPASPSYSRLYHSAALLLPDARVMSIGSNPANRGTYLAGHRDLHPGVPLRFE